MADQTNGPLVPAKYAALWGSVGLGLAVYAQAWAPQDLVGVCAAAASVALYAATGELPQPELLKRVGVLVPAGLVPSLGLLATGVHTWAVDSQQPWLHLLGTTLAVVTGTARQPTVGVRNGALRLVPLLLFAGLAQGCATTRMLAERPPEEVPHATAPGLSADLEGEERAKECRHVYYWRFFTGIAEDVASTFAGGAAGGAVLTEGDQQRLFAVGGLGFVALSKAFSGAHAELSSRYAEVCRER